MHRKTTIKRPAKPFKGDEGNKFSSVNQPAPEAKKAGWEERKKERLFTGQVWAQLVGESGLPLKEFTAKLIKLAEAGNPKAIERVLNAIEDEDVKLPQLGEVVVRIVRDKTA